nr:zinc finger cchc domain-containing protein 8 [Quercus suber]
MYNSLTRASKQKLEELLQQWSQWHAQHGSSTQDPNEVFESGEEMFFPALNVGLEKKSAVSFWLDNQTGKQQDKFIPLDSNSVPLYDRGYALGLTSAEGSSNVEGGLERLDSASRCFNCASYNHSLKECPKPRNNAAVNNARKQHMSKRNQNAGSRNSTRYYQNTPGGKYDGLRPGALDAETRKLLGLGLWFS